MPTNNALSGLGTTFSWAGNVVSDVNKIGGVEVKADPKEITNLLDTFKKYIPGMPDGGEVPIEGFLYPGDTTGQVALLNAVSNRTTGAVVITFPTAFAATWSFTGIVTSFKTGDVETEGGLPFSASIKIDGQPTLSITSSTGLTTPFFAISESAVINPTKSGSVYTYTASVLTGVTSVTVTPTATAGTITVNGSTVATGVASSAITLGSAGSITTVTIIVTETGKIPKTYTIYVTRL